MLHLIVLGLLVVLVVVAIAGYTVKIYNSLVSLREQVDQAKQNIDVLLKQRRDELTKLIDAASEYMDHEEEVLTELTQAREQSAAANTPAEQAEADQQVRQAMMNFEARAEDYPELRSQENLMQFQESISSIEDQIADRRELYNEAATQLNTRIDQFPYVLIANQFGFDERELFEATAAEKEDVDVGAAFDAA